MEYVTVTREDLFENIEGGLHLAAKYVSLRDEAYEGEMSAARGVVERALASLDLLRAGVVEKRIVKKKGLVDR